MGEFWQLNSIASFKTMESEPKNVCKVCFTQVYFTFWPYNTMNCIVCGMNKQDFRLIHSISGDEYSRTCVDCEGSYAVIHETGSFVVEKEESIGGIYIIEISGYHKIGMTTNLSNRMTQLNTSSPIKPTLVKWFPCDDYIEREIKLHKLFQDKRRHGEWFDLTPDDLAILLDQLQ